MDKNSSGLDGFFEAARQDAPQPTGDFMARMMQDALDAQPVPAIAPEPWWRQLMPALGGWPGAAGLLAACAAGVWIGVSPPASFEGLLGGDISLGTTGIDPLSGFDLTMLEG